MILAVTPGDPDGIGPEIVWKTIQSKAFRNSKIKLLCVGAEAPFQKLGARVIPCNIPQDANLSAPKDPKPYVWLLRAPDKVPNGEFLQGYQAGWSIAKATELVLSGRADALVTGPISKARLQKGGYPFPGHTEFLSHLCNSGNSGNPRQPIPAQDPSQNVTMVLANEYLRVALVTIHIGIKDVAKAINPGEIKRAVRQTAQGLRDLWGIKKPRIAVAALNPHAGESGRFGNEEALFIEPAIATLRTEMGATTKLLGPFPADTLFARHQLDLRKNGKGLYDAVVCMYHDQGLIPVKLLDFHRTVNVTLGLPIIRTSVDHGVAFDIAGKGIADASSLASAIELAAQFSARKSSKTRRLRIKGHPTEGQKKKKL